jgi:hypothetical protein
MCITLHTVLCCNHPDPRYNDFEQCFKSEGDTSAACLFDAYVAVAGNFGILIDKPNPHNEFGRSVYRSDVENDKVYISLDNHSGGKLEVVRIAKDAICWNCRAADLGRRLKDRKWLEVPFTADAIGALYRWHSLPAESAEEVTETNKYNPPEIPERKGG